MSCNAPMDVLPKQTCHQQHGDYLLTPEGSARHLQNHVLNFLTTDASDDELTCYPSGAWMMTEKAVLLSKKAPAR